jgi:hypothetical protein
MLTKGAVAKPEDAISPDEAVKDPYNRRNELLVQTKEESC